MMQDDTTTPSPSDDTPQEAPATPTPSEAPVASPAEGQPQGEPAPAAQPEGADTKPDEPVQALPAGLTGEQVFLILTAIEEVNGTRERPRGEAEQRKLLAAYDQIKAEYGDHPELKPVLDREAKEEREREVARGAGLPPDPTA